MFHLYLTLAYLFVVWRFVLPLPLTLGWRVALAALLLIVSKYHLVLLLCYGNMFSPEIPRAGVLVAGWLFCGFVLLFAFTLLIDVIGSAVALCRRTRPMAVLGWRGRAAIAALSLALSAFGVYQAAQVPTVKHLDVTIENLPPSLEGLRVVQLSDLHISRLFQADWVRQVVERTNALKPDVVLITGDLIDGTVAVRRDDVAPLGNLDAPLGVITILGNHEYYFNAAQWGAELQRLGMTVLVNAHATVKRAEGELVIAGVADEAAPAFGLQGPNLAQALEGASNQLPIILLKHRPAGAADMAAAGVNLQLSGHTHGGMIRGFDLVARYANQGFVSGRYDVGDMKLYVSNGTGLWNGFPIRLGVPAEITEIVLRASAPH